MLQQKQAKNPLFNFMEDSPFPVKSTPQTMAYRVNVDEDFTHPRQFEDIVDILEDANEGDYMVINLTTNGGALHAILPLLGAMQQTACHVHIHACSDVASAGTFLLLRAHSISMNDYITVMFHNINFGAAGTGHNVAIQVAHTMKSSERLVRDMYSDFFSEKDLEKIFTGTEMYLSKDEFIQRYEARMLKAQAKQRTEAKAVAKAIKAKTKLITQADVEAASSN